MTYSENPLLDDQPLSPDLDWMLLSDQADLASLADELARQYFAALYHLALAWLDDADAAAYVALRALVTALLNRRRYSSSQAKVDPASWFYRTALESFSKARTRLLGQRSLRAWLPSASKRENSGPDQIPSTPEDAALWLAVDRLPARLRMILLQRLLLGWPFEQMARVLQVPEAKVQAGWEAALHRITRSLQKDFAGQALAGQDLELRLRATLHARWPAQEFSAVDLAGISAEAAGQARREEAHARKVFSAKEAVWIAGGVLLAAGLLWGANRLLPEPEMSFGAGQATPSPAPAQTATPASADDSSRTRIYSYLVQPGDTLASIAADLNIPVEKLAEWNRLKVNSNLEPFRDLTLRAEALTWNASPPARGIPAERDLIPLNLDSRPEDVRQMLANSKSLWGTLWMDHWTIYYGPPGYAGQPLYTYHSQYWLQQPDRGVSIHGPLDGHPENVVLRVGPFVYESDSYSNRIYVHRAGENDLLSANGGLTTSTTAFWQDQPGSMSIVEQTEIAGRPALVVDWSPFTTGRFTFVPRLIRLWIDVETGVVLRTRGYDGPELKTIVFDEFVTGVVYEKELPFELFFDPTTEKPVRFARDYSGLPYPQDGVPPTPDAERFGLTEFEAQAPEGQTAPPEDYDLSTSWLTFVYPPEYSTGRYLEGITLTTDLYAGDYFLGFLPLPPEPWGRQCQRSSDGSQITYISYGSWPAGAPPRSKMVQVQLGAPPEVQIPELEIDPHEIAFSPDNRRLALFGYKPNTSQADVYLMDLESGQVTPLGLKDYAESLVWSPDGRYLAMLAGQLNGRVRYAQIIDVETVQIMYRIQIDNEYFRQPNPPKSWPAPDWPAHDWGVQFPRAYSGLEACARPPSEVITGK